MFPINKIDTALGRRLLWRLLLAQCLRNLIFTRFAVPKTKVLRLTTVNLLMGKAVWIPLLMNLGWLLYRQFPFLELVFVMKNVWIAAKGHFPPWFTVHFGKTFSFWINFTILFRNPSYLPSVNNVRVILAVNIKNFCLYPFKCIHMLRFFLINWSFSFFFIFPSQLSDSLFFHHYPTPCFHLVFTNVN